MYKLNISSYPKTNENSSHPYSKSSVSGNKNPTIGKQIGKLKEGTTESFIDPIALTAKRDKPTYLATNPKPMNAQILENDYHMPKVNVLRDTEAQIITQSLFIVSLI